MTHTGIFPRFCAQWHIIWLKMMQILSGKLKTEELFWVGAIFRGVFMETETPEQIFATLEQKFTTPGRDFNAGFGIGNAGIANGTPELERETLDGGFFSLQKELQGFEAPKFP